MADKEGTKVEEMFTQALGKHKDSAPYVIYDNRFQVTVGEKGNKVVLHGAEETLHFGTTTPDKKTIELMTDGHGKGDAFRVILDRDTNDITAVPYDGTDTPDKVKTFQNSELAAKIKQVWDNAVKLQKGETTPVITGEEAKALAAVVKEVQAVAPKYVPLPQVKPSGRVIEL